MPGIGELIEGAVQQAPHPLRQATAGALKAGDGGPMLNMPSV